MVRFVLLNIAMHWLAVNVRGHIYMCLWMHSVLCSACTWFWRWDFHILLGGVEAGNWQLSLLISLS